MTAVGSRQPAVHDRAWAARAYVASTLARWVGEVRPFVIVTPGRAGSELLVTLLNSHPSITCDGEILSVPRLNPRRLIDGRRAVSFFRGRHAFGLKLLSPQLADVQGISDPAAFLTRLQGDGWELIRVRRRNLLEQAISWSRSLRYRQYHHRVGDNAKVEAEAVDPLEVLSLTWHFENREKLDDQLFEGLRYTTLIYEDDLIDADAQRRTVERVCRVLGVADAPTSTDLVKWHPRAQRDLISNFDQVAAAVASTRYARYLE